MTNWLSSGLEFNAVIANNDEMAIGAIQALKAAGKDMKEYVVAGVDATQDALAAMVPPPVAVNLSAVQFRDPQLPELVKAIRNAQIGWPPFPTAF